MGHLTKTPNEYIRWRYANNGEDKESLVKVSMIFTEAEEALQKKPFEIQFVDDETGKISKVKKTISLLVGGRKTNKQKEYEYEIKYTGSTVDSGEYLNQKILKKMGWEKAMKAVDLKIAQRSGLYVRPLSTKNVEKHLEDCGLQAEFGTHYRMSALSGGQKVKVVLASALWNQPHILILDEPTNYSDRESLGALARAIRTFEGGVVMITHNSQFCDNLCPIVWHLQNNTLDVKGDSEWMAEAAKAKIQVVHIDEADMVDKFGNTVDIKKKKVKTKKEIKIKKQRRLKRFKECGDDYDSSDDE